MARAYSTVKCCTIIISSLVRDGEIEVCVGSKRARIKFNKNAVC